MVVIECTDPGCNYETQDFKEEATALAVYQTHRQDAHGSPPAVAAAAAEYSQAQEKQDAYHDKECAMYRDESELESHGTTEVRYLSVSNSSFQAYRCI